MTNIVLQDDPDIVLIQDTSAPATIQTGIVLVGSNGSVTGPGAQAVPGNVPQWANGQGTALGPGLAVGTNPSNLVQLDSAARLPAVNGSQLLSLPQPVLAAQPGGRLTLASGTPVMTSSVAGAGTIYWTPWEGQCAPITFDGATWTFVDIGGELSQALSDTTKSPAAAVAFAFYDMFLWWDSSTAAFRCTRGPAWTNNTTRSLALARMRGLLTNSAAITNGPAANFGLFVGTIWTDASGVVDYIFGSNAAGGGAGTFGIWNMYNRVPVATQVLTSAGAWTYATNAWRAAAGSSTYRVNFVIGIGEDPVSASYTDFVSSATLNYSAYVGVGLDQTTGANGIAGEWVCPVASSYGSLRGEYQGIPGAGSHYLSAVEFVSSGSTITFGGGSTSGLTVSLRL